MFCEHVHGLNSLFAGTAAGYRHVGFGEVAEVMPSDFGLGRPQ
jgi:hypothetical protein